MIAQSRPKRWPLNDSRDSFRLKIFGEAVAFESWLQALRTRCGYSKARELSSKLSCRLPDFFRSVWGSRASVDCAFRHVDVPWKSLQVFKM